MAIRTLDFTPVPSTRGFLTSEARIALIVGPVGSTKTTAGIMKVLYHAKRMARCPDGIRRSKAVWVRNTKEQLRDSSVPDFLKWFPDGAAGTYYKTNLNFFLKFDDIECEVLFRGLDDPDDVKRLLSVQTSFAILEEFREIDKDIAEALEGRCGRYPDKMMVPPRPEWGVDNKGNPVGGCVTEEGKDNSHMWGMSNPPDLETYWEEILSEPTPKMDVFFQPSAFSPEADWLQHVRTDYYEDLAEGKSQDYIDVYIHAKFGKTLSGTPVFKSFDGEFHVAKVSLRPLRVGGYPLLIGLDFGLTPAAVIMQQDMMGRVLVLDELVSEGMGILRFCKEKLNPLMAGKYAGIDRVVVGDPAGRQRVPTDESTVYTILKQQGYRSAPARTNSIVARIAAVEGLLGRVMDGKPGLLIDPGCRMIISGARGKYKYGVMKGGEATPTPVKNRWSHIMDALQYGALHIDGGINGQEEVVTARPVVKRKAGGWT